MNKNTNKKRDNQLHNLNLDMQSLNLASTLTTTLETISESFYILDEDWQVTYVNKELENITNKSKEELIGQVVWDLYPDLLGTVFEDKFRQAFYTKKAIAFEELYKPWMKWLEVRLFPSEHSLAVYIRDVTLRYDSLSQLKLLESCVARLNDIVVITQTTPEEAAANQIPTVVFVNEAFVKLMGYSKEEVLNKKATLLVGPAGQDKQIKKIKKAMKTFKPVRTEVINHTKSGNEIYLEIDVVPVPDELGLYTHCVIVARDITDRKKTEELLTTNKESLQFILDAGQVAYWDSDLINDVHFRSPLYVKLFGYKDQLPSWSYQDFLKHVHSEDRARVDYDYRRTVKGYGDYSSEFRVVWPNGETHWIWSRGRVVNNADGVPIRASGIMTDISERKRAEEQIQHLAFYDPLTLLPNRRLLIDKLQKNLIDNPFNQKYSGLLFIDLDNFKILNDTMGHDKGDILLKEVAHRIVNSLRKTDTVARLGGDEFVVVLHDLSESPVEAQQQIEFIAEKILAALNLPFKFDDYDHHSPASIGATIFVGNNFNIEELLKQADMAMYQAKAAGRNIMTFFKPAMQEAISSRVEMEADLRRGIAKNEFVLYYQPQINQKGHVYGAEALIRWIHPVKGLVPPMKFIPLAEETGLILELGNWVLEEACRQLVIWSKDPKTAHLTLAINVSIRRFQQPDFVDHVLQVLGSSGAKPEQLKLELTESILVTNMEDTIQKMQLLKGYGVQFSLDDFGTGYSSLAYLKRMPLQQLKIDQSFVRDMLSSNNDAIISKTIINLAQSLDLEVIAEGVETIEQQVFLLQNGCLFYQGYFFSKPIPVKEFNKFVLEKNI